MNQTGVDSVKPEEWLKYKIRFELGWCWVLVVWGLKVWGFVLDN